MLNGAVAYNALRSRDPRFDGVFFVGVTSTGVYCRPICPARTPKAANCRFFASAEAAEKASFRPCLRCRPELAPGCAPVDDARRVASLLAHRIEQGAADDGVGLERLAAQLSLSSRQLRRIVQRELGVSPIELVQTRRLLLAKQLLTETRLPVTEVAYASGFGSLRRFNDAFNARYRMAPGRLRKLAAGGGAPLGGAATSTLQLAYRPPYDWDGLLAFLRARAIANVEWVADDAYYRTVRIGKHEGWIAVRHAPERRSLTLELTHSLMPALPALLGRVRNLFDLNARPDVIADALGRDPLLAPDVRRTPGLRVPGAFDGFELAMRAVLGQQVTVKAATTLAGRLADAFGDRIATPFPALTRLAPTADALAAAHLESIARLGVLAARAAGIVALARASRSAEIDLDAGTEPAAAIARLVALPGIGDWTAHYIAMRALRWPDAFPKRDVVVLGRLGGVTPAEAERLSQAWRPWRSYAVLHLWRRPAPEPKPARARPRGRRASAPAPGARRGSEPPQ